MNLFTIYAHYTASHNLPHSIFIYSCPSSCVYSAQITDLIIYSFIHPQAVAILLCHNTYYDTWLYQWNRLLHALPCALCDRYVISLKSKCKGAYPSLTRLPCSRPVTHRISIKLQLTVKSHLISQYGVVVGKMGVLLPLGKKWSR